MRVHHIAFRTESIEPLGAFYEHVVGLDRIGGKEGYSIWFRMGAAVLMIEKREPDEWALRPDTQEFLGFASTPDECSELRARLAAAGVSIEEESAYTIYFRDPDGRRLGVSHFDFSFLDAGDPGSS